MPEPVFLSVLSFVIYLLLPPVSLAWLALLALLLPGRWRPRLVAGVLLVPLVLLSMPMVASALLASLDVPVGEAGATPGAMPGAIVILSAEAERSGAPGELEVGALTLERERRGTALQRSTGLPVLVTGGIVTTTGPAVGRLMAASMPGDFGVPVRWVEDRSTTTWENAQLSAPMLKAAGISRVFLVTHGWHMRRSVLAFRRAGLEPVPVAVRPDPWPRMRGSELVPSMTAWQRSYWAVHEWVGVLAYMWRGAP